MSSELNSLELNLHNFVKAFSSQQCFKKLDTVAQISVLALFLGMPIYILVASWRIGKDFFFCIGSLQARLLQTLTFLTVIV